MDNDDFGVLSTYYLMNPKRDKLDLLKMRIESRFDAFSNVNATDEDVIKAEKFCDNIWDEIHDFIVSNFTIVEIENFGIEY